jgi:hypothetical protein
MRRKNTGETNTRGIFIAQYRTARRVTMKLPTIMILKSISALIIGGTLLISPGFFLTLLGVTNSQGAASYGRLYGAACIGICVLAWVARNAENSVAQRAIILDLCVYDAIAFIVSFLILLSGSINMLGWLFAAFYLFFAIAFGYFLKPEKAFG